MCFFFWTDSLSNNMFKIQQHYIRCDTQIPVAGIGNHFWRSPENTKYLFEVQPYLHCSFLFCHAWQCQQIYQCFRIHCHITNRWQQHPQYTWSETSMTGLQGLWCKAVSNFLWALCKILFVDCAIKNLQRMITKGQQWGSFVDFSPYVILEI